MCNNWDDYDKEYSKRIGRMQMLEIKIKNMEIKLDKSRLKLHKMRNEFCNWQINKVMDLEERLGKRELGTTEG